MTIKNLTEMKLKPNDDPFSYVNKMGNLTESNHFSNIFWNSLDKIFKNQLIQICNKTRPSLADINDHFLMH